jgi:hypothetical protein
VQKCRSGVAGWGVSFERGFLRSVCVCEEEKEGGKGSFLTGRRCENVWYVGPFDSVEGHIRTMVDIRTQSDG